MSQPFRLLKGGLIDRNNTLSFQFNHRSLSGYAGDSLASALLANGIHNVSRSFKFHRMRGIYSAGEEEPCALVQVGEGSHSIPNSRATRVPLQDGLVAFSQLGWPGLGFDLGRAFDFTHRLWPAGFYNKTFKRPGWHVWEGMIRNMAGLGTAPLEPDPDCYEKTNAHCDLLIAGAGPAGLTSALVAGRSGLQVILADQDEIMGGSLNWETSFLDEKLAQTWLKTTVAELAGMPNVLLLPRTTVTASYDSGVFSLLERGHNTSWRECFWTVRSRAVLLATGAIEQSLVFPNNDRPGIMLAGAVRQYANRYAVAAGKQVAIATNNDSAYQVAVDLRSHGIPVAAVIDYRPEIPGPMLQHMKNLSVPVYSGSQVCDTQGTRRLNSIRVRRDDEIHRLECDVLAVSGGWAPRLHLLCHARGKLKFDHQRQAFLPGLLPSGFAVAGSASGVGSLSEVFARAEAVAIEVCESLGHRAHHVHQPRVSPGSMESGTIYPVALRQSKKRQWIDLAHDVTLDDAELAVREGFESVEHFKRYTTTGMSLDQGKTGNINAFLALAAITGKPIEDIGTTTFRPPYTPVTLGALAAGHTGENYAPRKILPADKTHRLLKARFEDYGWQRPDCYPRAGESVSEAIQREVLAVRTAVGVYDNSPIGKIEVRGPDAAEFLHRIYANRVHGLGINRIRYGLMLSESGAIIDDGVFIRLAENHFLLNTTSAGAVRILSWLEEWSQCEWPDLQVLIDDVTAQWANFTIAGPHARKLLQMLDSSFDLQAESLPHMSAAQGEIEGMEARVNRVSFSGELSYEVNLPAACANGFLQRILQLGEPLGLTPYGIEALMTLRLEKGYLHVGSDTDGETVPADVGWGHIVTNKAEDFIGKRSLSRPVHQSENRRQLVGLEAVDPVHIIHPGGHFLPATKQKTPAPTQGWVTSAAFSPTLRKSIALGMLRGGRELIGSQVQVYDAGKVYPVRVVPCCFYDPDNERLRS